MIRSATLGPLGLLVVMVGATAATSKAETRRPSEQIYAERCAYCHSPGGWGTRVLMRRLPASEAVLLDRDNLPPAYTALVVRRGIGAMPQFNPTEITNAELEELSRWLEDRN